MTSRIVVAYGGSIESAAAFAVLGARLGADVATVTLDLGQGADLEQVRGQALAAGAGRAHVVDARAELAGDVIRPALAAGAFEGSPLADGAGPSVWHRFAHTPGLVANGDTGDVACDHYRRWRDDVALMRGLGAWAYIENVSSG